MELDSNMSEYLRYLTIIVDFGEATRNQKINSTDADLMRVILVPGKLAATVDGIKVHFQRLGF